MSPAYVPDPMELDEHVPLYAPESEHPEHHVPSDDDSQTEDQPYAEDAPPTAESPGYIADSDPMEDDTDTDSIDYPNETGTDDEDEDEDPEKDPSKEHEPEDEDAKEDESSEDSDEKATVRLEPPMPASMEAHITKHAVASIPSTSPTYDQAPLGHRESMIPESSAAAAARAPRGQYDFVDAIGAGQGLIRSPGHDVQTVPSGNFRNFE
ncbi:hypothetical protein Tco_0703790 [Tanacetum coccineum]|uniref:Uncharacterized protein n=1 Tax=Tanacetum coccineum TaxID=301880 RepID=A0ABQ4XZY4_9ASTR